MTRAGLAAAALCAAFWTALWLYRGQRPLRFVAALALGALLARAGWALLSLPALGSPAALLDPGAGLCALFFPLGPLLLAREAAAFTALPLALAVARLGCLAAGCCHGPAGGPLPLAEIAAMALLHRAAACLPPRQVMPAVLGGLGLARLGLEPWRGPSPLGAPLVPPAALATAWLALGAVLAVRSAARCADGAARCADGDREFRARRPLSPRAVPSRPLRAARPGC